MDFKIKDRIKFPKALVASMVAAAVLPLAYAQADSMLAEKQAVKTADKVQQQKQEKTGEKVAIFVYKVVDRLVLIVDLDAGSAAGFVTGYHILRNHLMTELEPALIHFLIYFGLRQEAEERRQDPHTHHPERVHEKDRLVKVLHGLERKSPDEKRIDPGENFPSFRNHLNGLFRSETLGHFFEYFI